MATNFDYLLAKKEYSSFAQQAVEAERGLLVSPANCAILSRRALELAVRFVFGYDADLSLPFRDNISSLIHESSFRSLIDLRLFPLLKFVIRLGNTAVHTGTQIRREDAVLSLRNLFEFCDWIGCSYDAAYEVREFDESLLPTGQEQKQTKQTLQELRQLYDSLGEKDEKLENICRENEQLRQQMAELRKGNLQKRTFEVDSLSESETRRRFIDVALQEAGWVQGQNCRIEVEVQGMPTPTGLGYADYVLYGKDSKPLAVVEAKKSSVDALVGSQQAKLYADCLERMSGRRPLIFTTNGFEFFYTNDYCQEARRQVFGFFTQDELQLEVDRRDLRIPLTEIRIKDEITNRPYQKAAITACCESVEGHHRKLLVVQATGSGKTRVSISLVDVLRRHNYIKNILFLADRTALVRQAKKNFVNLLPDLTCCNLLDSKDDPEQCRMIFSTYPTILNAIDETRRKDGSRLFTPGHFDLIIVDESHRSIYNKYRDIFDYFDGILLGLTATPKDEIDKNTYAVFDMESGNPTFAYELDEAVKDKYLVDYSSIEYESNFIEKGIHYDKLSEEDKKKYEETFDNDENIGKDIASGAINRWLFNKDTIDTALQELMDKGLKVEGGDKLGKTIIFAKSSLHAKAIVERFNLLFPEYGGDFIKQIDYSIKYADTLLDDFSTKEKLPQIAVSVDMLDTGVDVPEILNLVFFKKVYSFAKFWQMIGRGTRLCPDLFGSGEDKEAFLIFDFCGNFDFFRANKKGRESAATESITELTFNTKVAIVRELQAPAYTADDKYVAFRSNMAEGLRKRVIALNDNSFRVKKRQRYVEMYRDSKIWNDLETIRVAELRENIAPLMRPEDKDELARRFDCLMYAIILATLNKTAFLRQSAMVTDSCKKLSHKFTIPQVNAQRVVIEKVLKKDFWSKSSIFDYEQVRVALRGLMQYLDDGDKKIYFTNFKDKIKVKPSTKPLPATVPLETYKQRLESYIKEHEDHLAVYKLHHNKPLTKTDLEALETVLWTELGSRQDYENTYGDRPVGLLVRKLVGLDRGAVNEVFSKFISDENLSSKQIDFVKRIVDYIVVNGNIEEPKETFGKGDFKTFGLLFKDRMAVAMEIMTAIKAIKDNSLHIA